MADASAGYGHHRRYVRTVFAVYASASSRSVTGWCSSLVAARCRHLHHTAAHRDGQLRAALGAEGRAYRTPLLMHTQVGEGLGKVTS